VIAASVIIAIFLHRHLHPPTAARKPKTIGQHIDAGRAALGHGDFLLAARELEAAKAIRALNPVLLSAAEARELTQLHRQAALLASWLSEQSDSLGAILEDAADKFHKNEQEWRRVFEKRYRGRAIVFDAEIKRDDAGHFQISYVVFVRGRQARLDLTDLQLLKSLPLQEPQRLLFGLRLADLHLEPEGVWVIRFEPDSGVLLTDLGAAAACCLQPEEELKELVERQAEWLASRPSAFP
jgi:hypothetical protein